MYILRVCVGVVVWQVTTDKNIITLEQKRFKGRQRATKKKNRSMAEQFLALPPREEVREQWSPPQSPGYVQAHAQGQTRGKMRGRAHSPRAAKSLSAFEMRERLQQYEQSLVLLTTNNQGLSNLCWRRP